MKKLYFTKEERLAAARARRRKKYDSTLKEKYIERIPESGCWIWTGQVWEDGYGYTRQNGKQEGAHRYMYRLYNGEFDPSLDVLHKCDVRSCVNPSHLWLGTHSDNMQDMYKKGRAPNHKGKNNPNYKDGSWMKHRDIE